MAPRLPAAACEISSYGNVQIERRPCSHSNGSSTTCGTSVTTSAHSRLSSQAGDRNGGSNTGEDDIASAVFGSYVSANRRLGFPQQESRASVKASPSKGSCSMWRLFGPRTSVPGLSGVRLAVDVVQQHRWVLAVVMEGKLIWLDVHEDTFGTTMRWTVWTESRAYSAVLTTVACYQGGPVSVRCRAAHTCPYFNDMSSHIPSLPSLNSLRPSGGLHARPLFQCARRPARVGCHSLCLSAQQTAQDCVQFLPPS